MGDDFHFALIYSGMLRATRQQAGTWLISSENSQYRNSETKRFKESRHA